MNALAWRSDLGARRLQHRTVGLARARAILDLLFSSVRSMGVKARRHAIGDRSALRYRCSRLRIAAIGLPFEFELPPCVGQRPAS